MGSVIPSSRYLARKIAKLIPKQHMSYRVIELGAGTGVITKAMLREGIPHHQITLVENSEDLARSLKEVFPQIEIIQGNAKNLIDLLHHNIANINTIVSSIPMLNLKPEEQEAIATQVEKILPLGGIYIQYTYGTAPSIFEARTTFKKISSKRIWLNFPPARVDVFKRTSKTN